AFRDDAASRLILVLINNSAETRQVHIACKALQLSAPFDGETSTASAFWQKLDPVTPSTATSLTVTLLPQSVASFGGNIAKAPAAIRAASAAAPFFPSLAPASIASLF